VRLKTLVSILAAPNWLGRPKKKPYLQNGNKKLSAMCEIIYLMHITNTFSIPVANLQPVLKGIKAKFEEQIQSNCEIQT
jgi:hypothetical protein